VARATSVGTLELRVPSDRFDDVIAGLRGFGTVEAVDVTVSDVGEEYVDVRRASGHRATARAAVDRFARDAHGQACRCAQVENELARVRGEDRAVRGRIALPPRAIRRPVTLAITVHESIPVIANHPGSNPITEATKQAWRNFSPELKPHRQMRAASLGADPTEASQEHCRGSDRAEWDGMPSLCNDGGEEGDEVTPRLFRRLGDRVAAGMIGNHRDRLMDGDRECTDGGSLAEVAQSTFVPLDLAANSRELILHLEHIGKLAVRVASKSINRRSSCRAVATRAATSTYSSPTSETVTSTASTVPNPRRPAMTSSKRSEGTRSSNVADRSCSRPLCTVVLPTTAEAVRANSRMRPMPRSSESNLDARAAAAHEHRSRNRECGGTAAERKTLGGSYGRGWAGAAARA